MPDSTTPITIGDLPAQHAQSPKTEAQARARFFNPGNAFNVILPPVPDTAFSAEPEKALSSKTPTGFIPCDASNVMECGFPATSPLVLAGYAKIKAGDTWETTPRASGAVQYVIQGSGKSIIGDEIIEWNTGDLFITPGGVRHAHSANDDAVLWVVTNEPQFRHEHAQPPALGDAPTPVVHCTAEEIERQIDYLYEIGKDAEIPGTALIISSDVQEASRNALPTLTVAMNTLDPGVTQRPHRHNSVAVSLVVKGKNCYSTVDGKRKDWSPFATTITPPVSVHSHTNAGDERCFFLIVQDGGFYYHARAMGFEFVDE
ncbi:MAG: cupin domain-containing protein [Rhodospirillales bacterium]